MLSDLSEAKAESLGQLQRTTKVALKYLKGKCEARKKSIGPTIRKKMNSNGLL